MKTILITRNTGQQLSTIKFFEQKGYICYTHALMKIFYLPLLSVPYCPDVLVVTSQHAALSLKKLNIPKNIPTFIVGQSGVRILTELNFSNIVYKETLKELRPVIWNYVLNKNHIILYVRGVNITAPILHPNAFVKNLIAYQAQLEEFLPVSLVENLKGNFIKAVALFSKRTAEHFETLAHSYGIPLHTLTAVCLSPEISDVLKRSWFKKVVI